MCACMHATSCPRQQVHPMPRGHSLSGYSLSRDQVRFAASEQRVYCMHVYAQQFESRRMEQGAVGARRACWPCACASRAAGTRTSPRPPRGRPPLPRCAPQSRPAASSVRRRWCRRGRRGTSPAPPGSARCAGAPPASAAWGPCAPDLARSSTIFHNLALTPCIARPGAASLAVEQT